MVCARAHTSPRSLSGENWATLNPINHMGLCVCREGAESAGGDSGSVCENGLNSTAPLIV